MRTGAAAMLLIWFGVAVPAAGAAQERAPPPVSVRLGFNANSARNMAEIPNVVAQRKGFFAREGLAVTMVPLMGTTHMVAALDKRRRRCDRDRVALHDPGRAQRLRCCRGDRRRRQYDLQPHRQAGHPRDRRPQRQARRALGAARHDHVVDADVARQGRVSKTAIIAPRRSSAARSGPNVSPAERAMPCRSANPTTSFFKQKGFRKLGDSLEVMPNLQFNVIAVRRSWAAAHKAIVVALARAFGDDVPLSARSGQSRRCRQNRRRANRAQTRRSRGRCSRSITSQTAA